MTSQTNANHLLGYQGVYPCPVCRWGQIQTMPLMEAMACNFCNQIFTANLEKQQLQMPSRQPPLTWRWNGKNWMGAQLNGVEFSWAYWLIAIALVMLPPSLIGITVYAFPPTPDTPLAWLPVTWVWLTFFAHLSIIGWLVIELYQFPVRAFLRIMWQQMAEGVGSRE